MLGSVAAFFEEFGVMLPNSASSAVTIRCFANRAEHKNDDKNKSCSVNIEIGTWKCYGCGESGNAFTAARIFGMSGKDAAKLVTKYGLFGVPQSEMPPPKLPHERQLMRWRDDLQANPRLLKRLQERKGWTARALKELGVGWDGKRLTFVIRDHKYRKVGVKRYLPRDSHKMLALPGSRLNLFPPPEGWLRSRPLFVVEGEPDVISLWSCRRQAVSVPGAKSWKPEWAVRLMNRQVYVLPDYDKDGRELVRQVTQMVPEAKVVEFSSNRNDGWDIGDMIAECAREGGLWQAQRTLDYLVRSA